MSDGTDDQPCLALRLAAAEQLELRQVCGFRFEADDLFNKLDYGRARVDSYVRTDAREPNPDGIGRRFVTLTPRSTAG